MTLQEFIDKYNGKFIDYDGHYGAQCQDLYRQYVQEVLGFPQSPGVVGAKDNWDAYLPDYYERIPNTPEGVPQPGDIMIWGASYGPYGHVAVVTEATLTTFKCFSQNDPTGAPCGIKLYRTYKPTLGWLHPKTNTQPIDQTLRIQDLEKEVAYKNEQIANYDNQVKDLNKKNEEITQQLTEATTASNGFRKQYNDFVANLATKLGTRQEEVEILAAVDTCITYEDKALKLDKQIAADAAAYQKTIDSLTFELNELKAKVTSLETKLANLPKPNDNITIPKKSLIDFFRKVLYGNK